MPARRFAVALTVAALALGMAACSDAGDGDSADAELDTSALVVYSGRNETLVQPLLDTFTEQTGVEVAVRYGDTAAMAAQLLEEGDRSEADVFFSQDAGALGALDGEGLLTALPQATLDTVPAQFRADDGNWVGVSGRARVLVYNPDNVAEADLPTSINELTEPEWSGRVGIAPPNASFQSFVSALRVLEGEDAAREWLTGMQNNDVESFDNNLAIMDAVDNGVVDVGLVNHYYWFERAAELGAENMKSELHYFPGGDAGSLVNVAGVAIIAGTDKAVDAQALVDFLLGTQAQTYFAEQTKEYPLIEGVDPVDGLPPLAELQSPDIDLSDLNDLQGTLALLSEVGLT